MLFFGSCVAATAALGVWQTKRCAANAIACIIALTAADVLLHWSCWAQVLLEDGPHREGEGGTEEGARAAAAQRRPRQVSSL